ncbi:MAG: hypothetical protein OHK0046_43080 [Anaerolineae bacterium]
MRLHEDQIVTVPNMMMYRCDVCGFREYDQDALLTLHRLLGQNKRDNPKPDNKPQPTRPTSVDLSDDLGRRQ